VYVHPVGAPHLIDPERLLASAERIYGERMDELWGTTQPAPAERVVPVADGAVVEAGGLEFRAIDSPGHAGHHHVFRLGDVGFVGDATGIRLGEDAWIDVPAPPPEFNLELWKSTLDRLRREEFDAIYRTHFGPTSGVNEQLDRFESVLEEAARMVRRLMQQGLDREAIVERYLGAMRVRAAAEGIDDEEARAYELANPRSMSVDGIMRYWSRLERRRATP
jgi:glyoxylase-like metal-dependent hydrolase (beta-lactamase superfamily II)